MSDNESQPGNPYPKPVRPHRDDHSTLFEALGMSAAKIVRLETDLAEPSNDGMPAPDQRSPIWSEDWEAWVYWDTTLETWFRHNADNDTWVPLTD